MVRLPKKLLVLTRQKMLALNEMNNTIQLIIKDNLYNIDCIRGLVKSQCILYADALKIHV